MNDNIFLLIESKRMKFTAVEQLIADYFLSKNRPLGIEQLAKEINVSTASITRFCKKINLQNYKELLFLYNLSMDINEEQEANALSVTASYHALATRSEQTFVPQVIEQVVELIHDVRIIHFWGMGYNSYCGLDFQFKFSRLGKMVDIISEENSVRMSATFANAEDLVIVATKKGEGESLYQSIKVARRKGTKVILITSNPKSKLIKIADVYLHSASLEREDSIGNISPQIPILIQLDIIYTTYLQKYDTTISKWLESEKILRDKDEII